MCHNKSLLPGQPRAETQTVSWLVYKIRAVGGVLCYGEIWKEQLGERLTKQEQAFVQK